jgi:hypothetical protein
MTQQLQFPAVNLIATDPEARQALVEMLHREGLMRAELDDAKTRIAEIERLLLALKANLEAKP